MNSVRDTAKARNEDPVNEMRFDKAMRERHNGGSLKKQTNVAWFRYCDYMQLDKLTFCETMKAHHACSNVVLDVYTSGIQRSALSFMLLSAKPHKSENICIEQMQTKIMVIICYSFSLSLSLFLLVNIIIAAIIKIAKNL